MYLIRLPEKEIDRPLLPPETAVEAEATAVAGMLPESLRGDDDSVFKMEEELCF